MNKKNTLLSALAGVAILAAAAPAQTPANPDVEGDLLVLNMVGQRGWRVSCELDQADGDRIAQSERGRGILHHDEIALRDVVAGDCAYEVPARGQLQMTLDISHTDFQCPFGASSDGFCQIQLEEGQSGRFAIRQAGSPAGAALAVKDQ